ncbi:MAG: efflux RND transporter periplasmic adaptor subunit [Formivibrio sp.]|nr:efflux RND transporter periplasmic adaptor subunit [Formivibrio sp.]
MQMQKKAVLVLMMLSSVIAGAAELATGLVRDTRGGDIHIADGVVEAVRQSVISAQVAGRITQLTVKAGDRVKQGQVLVKIDSQAATQQANVSLAQVSAAKAQLEVARKELARQQHLFQKQYISQAALDQAEAQFKATEAGVRGMLAQAGAANTQTGFFTLVAPYAGTVAEVSTEVGDMALPGKPLLTLYDPSEMRVVAALPQSKVTQLSVQAVVRLELTTLPDAQRWQQARSINILPMADAGSQTMQVRLGLPALTVPVTPGMFARAYFPLAGDKQSRLLIPLRAVVHRTELTAVYVVTPKGQVQLRQVRLGKQQGDDIEALAGVSAGERVALDPIAASRMH